MKNRYDESAARSLTGDMAVRVYTSRLYGRDPALVLHGGGNTSVKTVETDVFGHEVEVLHMKGSGTDLATIDADGFIPLSLEPLRRLKALGDLSDEDMEHWLAVGKFRSHGGNPSVETLVHAFLPHRFVDHTHADAVLALTNQADGEAMVKDALGADVIVLPYVRPGFPLAKSLIEAFEQQPGARAVVVESHGVFTFADDARAAYDGMIELVDRAEKYLAGRAGGKVLPKAALMSDTDAARLVQALRGACALRSPEGDVRRLLAVVRRDEELAGLTGSAEAEDYCRSGVLTPDHVIRTRNAWVRMPAPSESNEDLASLVGERVQNFADDYDQYFRRNASRFDPPPEPADPAPRVFLCEGLGIVALGETRKAAMIAADIAERTLRTKHLAGAAGKYRPIGEDHVFDMEYWAPQRKKLGERKRPPLEGQAALVTGGAGAIALGIADCLLEAGAAVTIADIDEERLVKVRDMLAARHGAENVGITMFDVTDYEATAGAVNRMILDFGGLDILVPNAGIAHVAAIEDLDPARFDQVLAVNLKGVFNVIKAAVPVFRRQGTGGNIVVISSKNVFDPGASFGAYSASKAGAHQLGKIAALELAGIGVRVNMINPDAVFGEGEITSKLWDLVGPDRMRCRGLDPSCIQDYYCERNLLKAKVTARHVGRAVVFFASDQTPTTGATLPIDGGVQGAFPR